MTPPGPRRFPGLRLKSARVAMHLWTIAIIAAICHGGDLSTAGLMAFMFTVVIIKDHQRHTGDTGERRRRMLAMCSRTDLARERAAHEMATAFSAIFSAALLAYYPHNPGAVACAALIAIAGIVNECVRHYCQLEPACIRRRPPDTSNPPGSSGGRSGGSGIGPGAPA